MLLIWCWHKKLESLIRRTVHHTQEIKGKSILPASFCKWGNRGQKSLHAMLLTAVCKFVRSMTFWIVKVIQVTSILQELSWNGAAGGVKIQNPQVSWWLQGRQQDRGNGVGVEQGQWEHWPLFPPLLLGLLALLLGCPSLLSRAKAYVDVEKAPTNSSCDNLPRVGSVWSQPCLWRGCQTPLLPGPSCSDKPTAKLSGTEFAFGISSCPTWAAFLASIPFQEANAFTPIPEAMDGAEMTTCGPCPEGTWVGRLEV